MKIYILWYRIFVDCFLCYASNEAIITRMWFAGLTYRQSVCETRAKINSATSSEIFIYRYSNTTHINIYTGSRLLSHSFYLKMCGIFCKYQLPMKYFFPVNSTKITRSSNFSAPILIRSMKQEKTVIKQNGRIYLTKTIVLITY